MLHGIGTRLTGGKVVGFEKPWACQEQSHIEIGRVRKVMNNERMSSEETWFMTLGLIDIPCSCRTV